MTILLIGNDQSAVDAWIRAGSHLPDGQTIARLSHADLDKSLKRRLDSEGSGATAAVLLEAVSDETLTLLIQRRMRIVYDPPVFDSASRLQQLASLAEGHEAWMLPLLPLRLLPVTRRIKTIAAAGNLGQLLYLKATFNERLPPDTPPFASALAKRGCHAIDLARWLLDGDIKDAQAFRGASDDLTILSFSLADKSYATVDISWSLPAGYPKPASITIEMAGTDGSIRSDALNQTLHLVDGASSRELNWGSDSRAEALRLLSDKNVDAPPVTMRELARAQALCEDLL